MDPIGAEDGFPDMWIQFGESSRLDYAFNHLGKHSKKIWYFFRNISLTGGPPIPPPLALPFFTVSPSSLCGGIIDFYSFDIYIAI